MWRRCSSYLAIPFGATGDAQFNAKGAPQRKFNFRYKAFLGNKHGTASIISKLAKLMVFWIDGGATGSADFFKFWDYVAPYFNPSNVSRPPSTRGYWTVQ